jgi:F-type H+-transporting ATPase subunit delta
MAEEATIARPYANALFDLAKVSPVELDRWSRILAYAAEAVGEASVADLLSRPDATTEQKARVLIDLCGDTLDDHGRNFIRLLSQNKRLDLVPEIAVQFEALRAAAEQTLDVEVISALPVSPALEQQLATALGRRFQREVKMTSRIDASLMGGAVIRAGDTVIDGSVRGRLEKLRESLARP